VRIGLFRWIALALLTTFSLKGSISAETFEIDPAHSSVDFTVRHIFSKVPGTFTEFSGQIVYDEADPEGASVEATISTASIDTKSERRDNHLRSADFFDAEKYPEISFKSTGVKKSGKMLMVSGDLTLHGVTKSVVLPVEVLGVGVHPMSKSPIAGFSAELHIMRSEFGVNNWVDKAGILSDEVVITINIEGAGAKKEE